MSENRDSIPTGPISPYETGPTRPSSAWTSPSTYGASSFNGAAHGDHTDGANGADHADSADRAPAGAGADETQELASHAPAEGIMDNASVQETETVSPPAHEPMASSEQTAPAESQPDVSASTPVSQAPFERSISTGEPAGEPAPAPEDAVSPSGPEAPVMPATPATPAAPLSSQGAPSASHSSTPNGYAAPHSAPASQGAPSGAQSPYSGSATTTVLTSTNAAAASGSKRRHRRAPGWGGVVVIAAASSLLVSAIFSGVVLALDHGNNSATPVTTASQTQATQVAPVVSSQGSVPDWQAVTAAVGNSVVAIAAQVPGGTSMGSGFIIDTAGHILTNNHVVSGATRIQVKLADGRVLTASLTGTDPATDLAVIALDNPPSDLTVATLGTSADLKVGQDVLAIGNPLGLSSTATTGIVSALDRPVVTTQDEADSFGQQSATEVYTNAIQIDAAVNRGNSGGPLFDSSGRVIGITSSIASPSKLLANESGSIGIGFAIPIDLASKVATQLIKNGVATHSYLGVNIADGEVTVDSIMRTGAKVTVVEPGSAADKAGLKKGDVIIAINSKPVSSVASLLGFVRAHFAGDTLTLTIVRDSKESTVQATLAERKDEQQ